MAHKFDEMNNLVAYVKDSFCLVVNTKNNTEILGYCSHVIGGIEVITINNSNNFLIISPNNIEFKAPKLGYVQFGSISYFPEREPKRVWKCGISRHNTKPVRIFENNVNDILIALDKVQRKQYANPQKLFDRIQPKQKIAISRRYAITNSSLEFCGTSVAKLNPSKRKIHFKNSTEQDFHHMNIASYGFEDFQFTHDQDKKVLNIGEYDYDYDV